VTAAWIRRDDSALGSRVDPKNEDVVTQVTIKPRDTGGRCPMTK
jgi:hypothetical protein